MKNVERPAQVETDDDRRQMLRWLVEQNGGATEVSRNTGLNRTHISRIMRGFEVVKGVRRDNSILDLSIETISKLLEAFSLSDQRAWELFNIPLERRDTWRSAQGNGGPLRSPQANVVEIYLDSPLVGDLFVPSHETIRVDESQTATGFIVAEINGRNYALRPDAIPTEAKVRGRYLGLRT